jgi:hypothetical protein
MRSSRILRIAAAATLGAALGVTGLTVPAQALQLAGTDGVECVEDAHADDEHAGESSAARGGWGKDHRDVSASEQRAISDRTRRILERRDVTRSEAAAAAATVPVHVHVMRAADGTGDVTDAQIAEQIAVLNETFGGQESSAAASTGFTFTLAGTYRYDNTNWHKDRQSAKYRSQTRKGGADALNMWLVDFDYLGIATFPWDYARNPKTDGIRVHYASLPGGDIANYDLGKTATHEAGHWLGLYHTFQGGCTATNDEVGDTPAQGSATNGCPEGRDSCSLPGLDPIHNYMDYSYDSCYSQFSGGQSSRMSQMWSAYRV